MFKNNLKKISLKRRYFVFYFKFRSISAMARKLTYALASAFHDFCQRVKEAEEKSSADGTVAPRKKFAIDLRTPEEMSQENEDIETEA